MFWYTEHTERKEFSRRPPPADLSKVRIAASAAFSSELRSCVMVLPERSGVMTSKMTVDFPVLVPPVLGESVKPAAPRARVRTSHRCVGCTFVWTPSRGLFGET